MIELGCGYARHLFAIRELIEHTRPDVRYLGAEIDECGIRGSTLLSELEPARSPVDIHPFDYTNPDFGFLRGITNAVVFTCHSVEQVREIPDRWFIELIKAVPNVTCIHHEPVGWQYNKDLRARVLAQELTKDLESTFLFGPMSDQNTAITPVFNGWNINLVEVIADLERRNILRSEPPLRNFGGDYLYNPTTQIVWTKA